MDSPDDLPEIQQAVEQIGGVSAEKVMLMPQAKTRDELIAKSPMVAQLCKETGYVFLPAAAYSALRRREGKIRIADCRFSIADWKFGILDLSFHLTFTG